MAPLLQNVGLPDKMQQQSALNPIYHKSHSAWVDRQNNVPSGNQQPSKCQAKPPGLLIYCNAFTENKGNGLSGVFQYSWCNRDNRYAYVSWH